MTALGEHAVVLGASMAGLLAARVLADRFERSPSSSATRSTTSPRPDAAYHKGDTCMGC
jgi:hypothetical protein